ncbi:TetR/AcrR family transcriptional regulator [Arthrobacter sp. SA17]
MSQRDNLLEGAKQCLLEKGFAATTARDIASISGANLASIGYHFGSKDTLMAMAAIQAVADWGDAVTASAAATPTLNTPAQRLSAYLTTLLSEIPVGRPVLIGLIQSHAQAQFNPDIRDALATNTREGYQLLAAVIHGVPYDTVTEEQAATTGATFYALVAGLVLQALIAPKKPAASGRRRHRTRPAPASLSLRLSIPGTGVGSLAGILCGAGSEGTAPWASAGSASRPRAGHRVGIFAL